MSKTTHWLILNLSDLRKLAKTCKKGENMGIIYRPPGNNIRCWFTTLIPEMSSFSNHVLLYLRKLYIVWNLVRRRVTGRLTRFQTMHNILKNSKSLYILMFSTVLPSSVAPIPHYPAAMHVLLVSCQISGPVVSMWAWRLAVLSNWLVHTAFSRLSAYLPAWQHSKKSG